MLTFYENVIIFFSIMSEFCILFLPLEPVVIMVNLKKWHSLWETKYKRENTNDYQMYGLLLVIHNHFMNPLMYIFTFTVQIKFIS